jgi:hypothetical protein
MADIDSDAELNRIGQEAQQAPSRVAGEVEADGEA